MKYLNLIGGNIGEETPDVSVKSFGQSSSLISTIDFFYPLVENPYTQGRIACCNVLSDLYAMGVTEISTVLMVLGVCLEMSEEERAVSTSLMIEGFRDCAKEAGTLVTGGQSIMSPWPIIGGVGISALPNQEFKMPTHANPGDQLVLTKPLGTQIAVNAYQWLRTKPD